MNEADKAGAAALVLGTIAYLVLMAFHPVDIGQPIIGAITVTGLVHGAAIVTMPTLAYGHAALARCIGFDRPLSVLALVLYCFSAALMILAATMSGVVMPQLVEAAGASGAPQSYRELAGYTHSLNQAFANVSVALSSLAISLFGFALRANSVAMWLLRVLAVGVGIGVLAWQVSGVLVLDIHGFGAVVILQSVWALAASVALWRGAKAA